MYKPSYRLVDTGPTSPCYDCHDRHMLCHSDCSKYAEFRGEVNAYNAKLYKARNLEDDLYNTIMRKKSKRRIAIRSIKDLEK